MRSHLVPLGALLTNGVGRVVAALLLLVLAAPLARAADAPHVLRDTLLLKDPKGAHISEAYRYFTEPFGQPADPDQAEQQWQAGKFRPGPWHKTLNLGVLHQRVWMRLVVRNTDAKRLRFLWSIFNFADSAALYCRRQGDAHFTRLGAASSWTPAEQRTYPARSLSFPFELAPQETAVLLLRADVHTGGVYLPTYIETAEHFLAWEMGFPFERYWVWLLGFYLSSALFNLVLYVFLRDRIHLWYIAYVVCVTLFLMMEDGLDTWLLPGGLYRLIWTVGQYNFMLLAAAVSIVIMSLFLRLRAGWPGMHQAGNGLAIAAVLFVAFYAVVFPSAVQHNRLLLVEGLNDARDFLMLLVFGFVWTVLGQVLLHRRQRRLAAFYLLTYVFFFTGFAIFWSNHKGWTSFNPVYPNALAWGLLLELLVLSALLTGRFQYTMRQNAQLRIRQLRQRNALSGRLIAAQEEERERLARELHDALGPNLMALHLAWQGPAVRQAMAASPAAAAAGQQAELLLRHLRDDVRTISHGLLPAQLGQGSLAESIRSLGELINLHGSTTVHTYCDQGLDQLPLPLQQTAYRIAAELLNNAVRHAAAAEVHVQVLLRPGVLEILVEDNGRGFQQQNGGAGIGLRGVRARADYLHGHVHVDTSAAGTSIIVQLPC